MLLKKYKGVPILWNTVYIDYVKVWNEAGIEA